MKRVEFEEAFTEIEKMFHMKPSSDFYKDAFFDEFASVDKNFFLRTAAKIAAHGHRFTIDRMYEAINSSGESTNKKEKVDCIHCGGYGLVSRLVDGYEVGLRCVCLNADAYSSKAFPRFTEVKCSPVPEYKILVDGEWEWHYQKNKFVTRSPRDKRGKGPKDSRQIKDLAHVNIIIDSLEKTGTYQLE